MSGMWDWWREFAERALLNGDRERLRLVRLQNEAYRLRETDLGASLGLLRDASQLAGVLGEPWCQLHFDHMYQDILLHHGGDCRTALDLAIRNVLEVRKPFYENFPKRFPIHLSLVCTYLSIDPAGYESEIRDLLAHLDDLLSPSMEEGHAYFQMQKVRLALKLGLLEEAHAAALHMLDLAEGDGESACVLYSVYAHSLLCRVAFRQGDLAGLTTWARDGVQRAEQDGEKKHHTAMVLWQAVLARKAGDEPAARRLYRRAETRAARWTGLRFGGYYNALSAFHEHAGEWEQVLQARAAHWENVQGCGRVHDEAFVLSCRCATLAQLGRLSIEEITRAEEAARQLRRPAPILAELADLRVRYL
jgi:hypothetical protein